MRPALTRQAQRRTDLPWRAVAALESIMANESLLQRVQRAPLGHTFDGGQRITVAHDSQGQTGIDPPTIAQHRARPALAVVATFAGAHQVELVTQQVEQSQPGRQLQQVMLAIDGQLDGQQCCQGFAIAHDQGLTVGSGSSSDGCFFRCDPGWSPAVQSDCQERDTG
ncbi:hypothetical protein WR25_17476 [Diploscapter pachys]|uniref:Uncharacterized protein n=1 Tax=Diploscapter pachys TaxID=2018661 RepID=A0A2A2JWM2_9BILA|nr:hypothetical protein WR25_17476 [Diploscapter pachys]